MPFVYTLSLATAGNLTTNATPATETETAFVKAGARDVGVQAMYVIGKGAGFTTLSGLAFRVIKWGTASTAGVGMTAQPADPGAQAAKATSASRPTSGTTRTNRTVFGCGATGPGGWIAPSPESRQFLEAASTPSVSVMDVSGTASMPFEFSMEIVE